MRPTKSIQLKAAFLLLVFAFNTVLAFACSLGLKMGYNNRHPGTLPKRKCVVLRMGTMVWPMAMITPIPGKTTAVRMPLSFKKKTRNCDGFPALTQTRCLWPSFLILGVRIST